MYYVLLKGGNDQLNKQFILTQKEQQALVDLNKQWNQFWYYIKQIGIKLSGVSAVLQTRFVKMMTNALQLVGEVLVKLFKIIDAHKSLKFLVLAIGTLVAWYFAPWLVVLGAIALVLDDIMGYFDGRDSITGRLVNWAKKSKEFQDTIKGITILFRTLVWTIQKIGEGIENSHLLDVLKLMMKFYETDLGKRVLESALKSANLLMNPVGAMGGAYNELQPLAAGAASALNDYTQSQINNNVKIDYVGSENAKRDGLDLGNTLVGVLVNNATRQNPYLKFGTRGGGPKYGQSPLRPTKEGN